MRQRWQDWIGLVLGVLLFLSPWLLGYADEMYAASSAWVFGIAAIVLFGIALLKPGYQWNEWAGLALAVLLLVVPFALSFVPVLNAAYAHWVLGALIGIDSVWALYQIRGQAQRPA